MADYTVYEPRELAVTTGDRVRLQEKIVVSTLNRSSYQTINGPRAKDIYERGSIQIVESRLDDGSILFKSGLVVHPNDGRLGQGYVSTSIPAQGSTVDWLFCYESVKSLKALGNLGSMYVNVSRHVKGMALYTESIDALRQWGARKHDRQLASEAVRLAQRSGTLPKSQVQLGNFEAEGQLVHQLAQKPVIPELSLIRVPSPSAISITPAPQVTPYQRGNPITLREPPALVPAIADAVKAPALDKMEASFRDITRQVLEERLKRRAPRLPENPGPELDFS